MGWLTELIEVEREYSLATDRMPRWQHITTGIVFFFGLSLAITSFATFGPCGWVAGWTCVVVGVGAGTILSRCIGPPETVDEIRSRLDARIDRELVKRKASKPRGAGEL